jgi:phage N-6-adenine-methyltransferase
MNIDWQTPKTLFANLEREFHFTLDVCALPWNAQCKAFFSPADNGLARDWSGVCWCNPPFDRNRILWVRKCYEQAHRGVLSVVLLNANAMCDTAWFHGFAMRSSEIRFLRGRPSFVNAEGRETSMRTMLLVFRPYCSGPPVVSSVDRTGAPYTVEGLQTAANTQRAKCPQLAMELEL